MAPLVKDLTLAFIPGTGTMGFGLARSYAKAGCKIIVGSRSAENAKSHALKISNEIETATVIGCANKEAAAAGDVIFWSPNVTLEERGEFLRSLASELQGKIMVDVTNIFYKESEWGQTSSTLINQEALGVPARWTTGFKATFWKLLDNPPSPTQPHNVFVCGDDNEAIKTTIALVNLLPGFQGVNAGPLKNTKIVELLGPALIVELDQLNANGSFRSGWRFGI